MGFPVSSAGLNLSDFKSFIQGNHTFCKEWSKAQNPKVVLSSTLFEGSQGFEVLELLKDFSSYFGNGDNPVNILNL